MMLPDSTDPSDMPPLPADEGEQFRLLQAAVEDYALILHDMRGRIVAWNAGAERITGYTEDEAIGQPSALIFTEEDRVAGAPEQELSGALTNGRADDVRWHRRKDGSRFWAEGVMTLLTDGGPRGFCKILRDLTERKRAEDELRASNERLEDAARHVTLVLESIGDAFYAVDADFRFTYVNRRAEEWWKRDRADLIGRHYWTEFPSAMESEAYRHHLEVMRDRRPIHFETVSPLLHHWIDVSIYPAEDGGLAVYFRDITERKQNEQALRETLERERNIARTLQRPLTLTPEPNAFPGLTLATRYEPASEEADAGGDFFDAFELPRGRVGLAVADASGKGLQAAARAIQVKEVLRAFTREYPHSPAHIASRVNDYLYESQRLDIDREMGVLFVTLVLAVLDPLTGEAAVVSAAAEPPLLLRSSGAVELVEPPLGLAGMPLGVQGGEMYHAVPLRLGHGDTLLLTTDGVTEARRDRATLLGMEGLSELAQATLSSGPVDLQNAADSIVKGAREFARGRFRDDVCLLLARRK
jgi:PAS domain S-box-containing protein